MHASAASQFPSQQELLLTAPHAFVKVIINGGAKINNVSVILMLVNLPI
jgi:hypothetical protein